MGQDASKPKAQVDVNDVDHLVNGGDSILNSLPTGGYVTEEVLI